jgi:predicted ATP-grasp superfamily ATP-dependent carboligase
VDFLLAAACHIGGRPVLLPTNDETALFVAEHEKLLDTAFVFPHNPLRLVRELYDKREMHFLARRLGIPTAATSFPHSRSEVAELAASSSFPVMLKAADNIAVARRTGKKMIIARTPEDLLAYYDAMEDASCPSLMLQEYIPEETIPSGCLTDTLTTARNACSALRGRKSIRPRSTPE